MHAHVVALTRSSPKMQPALHMSRAFVYVVTPMRISGHLSHTMSTVQHTTTHQTTHPSTIVSESPDMSAGQAWPVHDVQAHLYQSVCTLFVEPLQTAVLMSRAKPRSAILTEPSAVTRVLAVCEAHTHTCTHRYSHI